MGAASSREKESLYGQNCRIAAGSRSHSQNCFSWHILTFLGSNEVSFSVKLAAFQANSGVRLQHWGNVHSRLFMLRAMVNSAGQGAHVGFFRLGDGQKHGLGLGIF